MNQESDFEKAAHAYNRLKLFLARCVGFVAVAYGAVTFNAYFFILGLVAVGLFWLWDRMIAADTTGHDEQLPPGDATGKKSN